MADLKTVTLGLTDWLKGHGSINEVTLGDLSEVDITTITNFPLAHVIPIGTAYNGPTAIHEYQVLILSTYDNSVEVQIEVLSNMELVVSDLDNALNTGTLYTDIVAQATLGNTADIMYDQFVNRLYGYSITVKVIVERNTSC